MLITLLMLALAGRSLVLQCHAARHSQVHRRGPGWWTVELRRLACMSSLPNDLQAYPQPREFRILVWRLAGVPLWWRGSFVSLPQHCDATLSQLDAQQFDQLFDSPYRLHPPAGAVTGWHALVS